MPNYVSATTRVHGEHENISEFIENSVSKPDGTYEAICLGGLHTELIIDVAKLWNCYPRTLQELRESLTPESTNISFGFECAWGAPHEWLREVSEKYPCLYFIMAEDSMENNSIGVTAYQGGLTRYEEFETFAIPDFLHKRDKAKTVRPTDKDMESDSLWDDFDVDYEAISSWLDGHVETAADNFWALRKTEGGR
jgi:hypothetical protein